MLVSDQDGIGRMNYVRTSSRYVLIRCHLHLGGFPGGSDGKASAMRETQVQSLGWEDPLEKEMGNPLQNPCLENPMDKRSLVGYSPWGHKESDMTE